MGIRLLLDEDCQAKSLLALLRAAGHDVTTVGEEGLGSRPDSEVLAHAHADRRVVLTYNVDHFRELHKEKENSGIFAIFRDQKRSKNMSRRDILNAISKIEHAGLPLAGEFISLNPWR